MFAWFGMRHVKKTDRQFFGNLQKRTVTLILLTALLVLNGVKSLLTYLIPAAYLTDSIIAVLPGTVGVLVALVYVLVLERMLQDKTVDRKIQ